VIPDAYKDRGWVEKVKSPDDLWKTLDNAQSLLGRRPAGIPAADAPDEEWQKFYQAARPESPDKYTLGDIEGLPEGTNLAPYKEQAQKLMYDVGLTQKQADLLWKQYIGAEMGAVAKSQEGLDKLYSETLDKTFGDKKADAEAKAQEIIAKYVPEALRGNVQALVNAPEAMVGVIALANEMQSKHDAEIAAIKAEYGVEGKLPDGGDKPQSASIDETVAELSKLRLSPEAQDFTKAGHKKAMDRIAELQAVVARHYNK
jgi:hypothetical protein